MSIFHFKDYGYTSGWWESFWRYNFHGNKRIRLAVVGTPSSGKSYLLSDIIQSFNRMGLKQKRLPLSFPYRSFGVYNDDIVDANGIVGGTPVYACRHDNHYGAMLKSGSNDKEVDIEFLNLPGEIFGDKECISLFFTLKNALERIRGKMYTVIKYQSPGERIKLVVVPSEKIRGQYSRDYDKEPQQIDDVTYKMGYGNWPVVHYKLQQGQWEPVSGSGKNVSGKYLLDHFYEFDPDSLMQSISDTIPVLDPSNSTTTQDRFLNEGLGRQFYFYMYCQDATDIIICDKIFAPNGQFSDQEQKAAQRFNKMIQLLNQFLVDSKSYPNVYLAFRGADMMLNESVASELRQQYERKYPDCSDNIIYSLFVHNICKYLDPEYEYMQLDGWIAGVDDPGFEDQEVADVDRIASLTTVTGMTFGQHIKSRIGTKGSCMWLLYNTVGKKREIDKLLAMHMRLAPHVYFTATPIDVDYNIYVADQSRSNKCFIRTFENGQTVSFDTANNPLCFGTTQLCADLLKQAGIKSSRFRMGELLKRFQIKLK